MFVLSALKVFTASRLRSIAAMLMLAFLGAVASCGQTTSAIDTTESTDTAMATAEESIPPLPWPPAPPSARYEVPRTLVANSNTASLYDVSERLVQAMETKGYTERSFYSAPNGFAIVARLEGFDDTGRPLPSNVRFTPPGEAPFNLADYLRGLFVAPVGNYRVIVFIVTDASYATTGANQTVESANELLTEGANRLPASYRNRLFSANHRVDALIYEFEKTSAKTELRRVGTLTGQRHLMGSGLLDALSAGR